MMGSKGTKGGKSVTTIRHKDKRANIPTQELRGFMEEAEKSPTILRYPRDPSLDPQLVWRGKDEQDGEDLTVPSVPIYIQEKIHPKAIIDTLRAEALKGTEPMADLFADFNNIAFQDLIEFYEHEQNWSNRLILGDSLLVMASLAEKEGLRGKVQMIYVDPPYGIKFGSNWQVSTRKRDVKDGKVEDATREPEMIKAFRDTWALGIHSYLTYMRDRFVLARELLHDSGSIFVQISDTNLHLVRAILDEVFGANNCAGLIAFRKTSGLTADRLAQNSDFLLWYARDIGAVKFRQLYATKGVDSDLGFYGYAQFGDGSRRRLAADESRENLPEDANLYSVGDLTSSHFYSDGTAPFEYRGRKYSPGNRFWTTSPAGMMRLAAAERLHQSSDSIRYVRHMSDFPVQPLTANWTDTITGQYSDPRLYVGNCSTRSR